MFQGIDSIIVFLIGGDGINLNSLLLLLLSRFSHVRL